jgi:hypothetical protein
MIEFSESIKFWSAFTFWFVTINIFITVGFIVVVIIGGFFDLKFLFKALKEDTVDETDDGRVLNPSTKN